MKVMLALGVQLTAKAAWGLIQRRICSISQVLVGPRAKPGRRFTQHPLEDPGEG
jgi:hypothetical protein